MITTKQGHFCFGYYCRPQCLLSHFVQITESLSPDSVQRACSSTGSSSSLISSFMFYTSITTIHLSNALVDAVYVMSGKHHFDDEMFKEGRNIISAGTKETLTSFITLSTGHFRMLQLTVLHPPAVKGLYRH